MGRLFLIFCLSGGLLYGDGDSDPNDLCRRVPAKTVPIPEVINHVGITDGLRLIGKDGVESFVYLLPGDAQVLILDRWGIPSTDFHPRIKYMQDIALVYEGHPVAPRIDASVVEGVRAVGYYSEYMRGENLKVLLEKGSLTARQKKEILRQVSDQIQLLHGAGKYHGDLKASNLMVEIKENKKVVVRLIDFFGPLNESPPQTGIDWDVRDLEILKGFMTM